MDLSKGFRLDWQKCGHSDWHKVRDRLLELVPNIHPASSFRDGSGDWKRQHYWFIYPDGKIRRSITPEWFLSHKLPEIDYTLLRNRKRKVM